MNRAEYHAARRAYRDAVAACRRCRYPGSNYGLSLACARERARELVPGLKYDPYWVESFASQQLFRREHVLKLLATLRAYHASNVVSAGYYGCYAVVQRELRTALSPIKGN